MQSKPDHFRIKIDFSEVTSSFWKQSWFYVNPGSIEDLWRRLAEHFLEQVHDPEPRGSTYGLFLEDRYLFKNLPVNVLKEDDMLKVKVLHDFAVHMNWDGNRIHLKLEQEMNSKYTQHLHSRIQIITLLQNGEMDRNSQNIALAERDTAESIDQDATTKELEAIPNRAAEPQILTLNSCIPATEDVPNHPVPKVKSSRKRNIPAESFESPPPISQYEPRITRSRARSRTESLPSDSAIEATNLTEPEAEQIPLKPKKKKSRESVRQDANNITDEANMAEQLPESYDTTMDSSDVISSFPVELEQDSATIKRKRTRRRVRKAANACPEPEVIPLPQMGTFKGHSFYKPPLSKRSYASDAKTNTLIRFDDEVHDQVNAKPEEDETLQAKANTQWDEALPLPADEGTTETVLTQFQFLTIPLSVTPAAKSQPAANPGLGNLFALTQSPVVFNRVHSASTPSVQTPLAPLIAAQEAKPSFKRASKASSSSSVQMSVEQRTLQVNGKEKDRENPWEIKDYQQYPLISEPRLNEIIAFKELELSASYEPVMSDYKVAQVHHICPMTKNVKLEIVAGDSKIVRSGKFELEDDEEYVVNLEDGTESKTKEYVWKDLKETRLIYP